MTESIH